MSFLPLGRRRSVILLQGPVGPFFAALQGTLEARGWRTLRLVFNGGDEIYAGAGRLLRFDAPPQRWVKELERIFRAESAQAVFMFGDQRPIHLAAKEAAARGEITVVSFEEGYLRPNFVTMEIGGNNACSPLRDWRPGGEEPPPPIARPTGASFAVVAWLATRYFVALRLAAQRYPAYVHHRRRGLVRESFFWTRSLARKLLHLPANRAVMRAATTALAGRHFILALQVFDDLQLRRHGRGWTVGKAIEATLASFARAAPTDLNLLVKGHPLDRGHSSARRLTHALAAAMGIAERVHYLDDGPLGLLSQTSLGMVTINSTSALVAFNQGKPVFALGDAFYAAFTTNGTGCEPAALDGFWAGGAGMSRQTWLAFAGAMGRMSLVNGGFYRRAILPATCARVVDRVEALFGTGPEQESAHIDDVERADHIT